MPPDCIVVCQSLGVTAGGGGGGGGAAAAADDDEDRDAELLFRIGVALSSVLVHQGVPTAGCPSDASERKGFPAHPPTTQAHAHTHTAHTHTTADIYSMLTEYSDVKDVVMQAHLLADGGTR